MIIPLSALAATRYNWPGNVREMEHAIEYMMNITGEEQFLSYQDLPPYLKESLQNLSNDSVPYTASDKPLEKIMNQYETKVLKEALRIHNFNIAQCARSLGIRRETLYYRLHKLGIDPRNSFQHS